MIKPTYIIGAGGHAKVIISAARLLNLEPWVICEDHPKDDLSCPYLLERDFLKRQPTNELQVICGLGSIDHRSLVKRHALIQSYLNLGFSFVSIIHPSATVDPRASIQPGTFVAAQSVVHADAKIGAHSIVNTGAIVEHDVIVGIGSHLAPGSITLGGARIGDQTHIGAGAIILQGLSCASHNTIGAGALCTRSIEGTNQIWIGTPARSKVK